MSDQLNTTLMPLVTKLDYWAEFEEADKQAILDLPHNTRVLERNAYIVRERAATTHSCSLDSRSGTRLSGMAHGRSWPST